MITQPTTGHTDPLIQRGSHMFFVILWYNILGLQDKMHTVAINDQNEFIYIGWCKKNGTAYNQSLLFIRAV